MFSFQVRPLGGFEADDGATPSARSATPWGRAGQGRGRERRGDAWRQRPAAAPGAENPVANQKRFLLAAGDFAFSFFASFVGLVFLFVLFFFFHLYSR